MCKSCMQIMNDNFSDLIIIEPKGNYILIDDIRELRSKLSLKSYSGNIRGVIIDEADLMTVEASNALLKTLEEPGLNTIFILITSRPNRIISTIASRCQTLNFVSPKKDDIERELIDRLELKPQIARFLSRLYNYNFYRAKEIASDEQNLEIRDQILNILSKILNSDYISRIKFALKVIDLMDISADEIEDQMKKELDIWKNFALSASHLSKIKSEIDIKKKRILKRKAAVKADWIMDIISSWYRDLLLLKFGLDDRLITNIDFYNILIKLSNNFELKQLIEILNEIQYMKNMVETNINLSLAMETLFLKIGG